ncbi:MAG TPA: bifunctional DNA-formamidopyrimidine glycosylase/DNA-(apurinic or apyrimidinic site) lyase [Candidatus Paceibacterota bacterium]|nr:bifunctional DNA-formamidopyrimidine glycosylase/DNA-(apurinic or apyrimidinic site) lyase [Candidatus Paceibacterota bacterium]
MPELPEVETLRRELKILTGKKISETTVKHPKAVLPLSPAEFAALLKGRQIKALQRRAKVLMLKLSGGHSLLIHLKMTGQLIYVAAGQKPVAGGHPQKGGLDDLPNRYTHIWFDFTDGSKLYFNDLRKFGWMKAVSDETAAALTKHVGPEPLGSAFTPSYLQDIFARHPKRTVKQILLDQTLIAGIGNIYADESCYLARILPMRRAGGLTPAEIKKLHQAIIGVLKLSIKKKGTSARDYVRSDGTPGGFNAYLNVYGQSKKTCSRCGGAISKIKFQGRGTHFCPRCQKDL